MWFEKVGNTCVAKFMHHPGRQMWILGLNFFNKYYSVFDYETQSIGFAPSINFNRKSSSKFVVDSVHRNGNEPEMKNLPSMMNLSNVQILLI